MEADPDAPSYSIGELADLAGVSRRTVRYYVQRNLIDPPQGRGRGSVYTRQHAEQIQRVLRLQRQGLPLQTIQSLPEGEEPEPAREAPRLVMRVPLAAGIRLEVDAGADLPAPQVLDALAAACARILGNGTTSSDRTGAAPEETGEEDDHD